MVERVYRSSCARLHRLKTIPTSNIETMPVEVLRPPTPGHPFRLHVQPMERRTWTVVPGQAPAVATTLSTLTRGPKFVTL